MPETDASRVLCFATQGQGHIEDERIRALLAPLGPETYAFDRARKIRSAVGLLRTARARRPSLIVMEGTGSAGGLTLMMIDSLLGIPFVVSSGDAVGPYLGLRSRVVGAVGEMYERALCRRCVGYVGWTPYLVGRALTFGAPRGMTAPGWTRGHCSVGAREEIRARLGIAADAIVVGIAGSLHWREKVKYVYGAELVRAVRQVKRRDIVACIVGDGSGRERLEEMAGQDLGVRILLPGRVAPAEVPDYLSAFDLASLPQSVDGVGSFRYSTKLSEYFAAELPIIIGEIPVAYDLDEGFFWRLPGEAPWSDAYVNALAETLETLSEAELTRRRAAVRGRRGDPFDQPAQQRRMVEFVTDILQERARAQSP
ncbi:MAG: glycosyltransferase [Actinomycetota bacterium]|nr:glycosyltransferase [Actinomycetota bacterium]